jgi:tetratricopeptide (TPR) repeat protein
VASSKPSKKPAPSQTRFKPQEPTAAPPVSTPSQWYSAAYIPYLIIFLFTTAIYFNSIWDKYAIDDTLVLTDNKFTLQGFGGIQDIMTKDAFVGFFGERGAGLVSGGRYRPLSMVTLAIEVAVTGGLHPGISHFINIMLFALTCLLLYRILADVLPRRKDTPFYLTIAFIATMLYAGHPIHTEAVTNIKGRDEVMGMLFSLAALWAAIRFMRTNNFLHLLWGTVVFFLALMSKENAITFLAVIPMTLYFFTKAKPKDYAVIVLYLGATGVFLYLRTIFTHSGLTAESPEILNNPFAYIPKTTEGYLMRYATIIYSFLLYFKLLIFPHPLTHDYYFNQIPIIGPNDPLFILSLVINVALLGYAVYGFFKKSIPAYAILFYFITFSVVSNIFFTVGIIMNERFVYMCSLGFCILLAYLLVRAMDKKYLNPTMLTGLIVVILALYSVKTFSRNFAWKDNLTLFLVDSKVSTRSAKIQMSCGGDLDKLADQNFDSIRRTGELQHYMDVMDFNEKASDYPDSTLKKQIRKRAIEYIDTSLAIYPTHSNALVLRGNASYKLYHDVQGAMRDYENAAKYRVGGYYDAWYNMGCVQIENNMPEQAVVNFKKALAIDPEVFAARYNLAEAYYKINMADSAIYWYKKTLELKPLDDKSYYKIGTVYGKLLGNLDLAIVNISKAIDCNPKEPLYYEDLAVAYGLAKRYDEAILISNKCLQVFPNYIPAYMNLAVSYRNKGDIKQAEAYMAKANELRGSAK